MFSLSNRKTNGDFARLEAAAVIARLASEVLRQDNGRVIPDFRLERRHSGAVTVRCNADVIVCFHVTLTSNVTILRSVTKASV